MLKIKVVIPTTDFPRFRVSNPLTNRISYRKTIGGAWDLLERRFTSACKASTGYKTSVLVKDGLGYVNETYDSPNPAYLGFTARCFLEELLKPGMRRRLEKKYPPTDKI